MESARETVQRRADGDLRDAAERLAEERERFKLQLGVIHADILRLRAEAAELERRNQELELARSGGNTLTWSSGSKWRSGGSKPKYFQPGDDLTVHKDASETGDGVEREGEEKGEKAPVEEGRNGDVESERTLREALEEEREALRRMCNGLAVDLQTAVEAEAKAKEERQALVQVGDCNTAATTYKTKRSGEHVLCSRIRYFSSYPYCSAAMCDTLVYFSTRWKEGGPLDYRISAHSVVLWTDRISYVCDVSRYRYNRTKLLARRC